MAHTCGISLITFFVGGIWGMTAHWLGVTAPLGQIAAGAVGYLAIDWLVLRWMKWRTANNDFEQDQHTEGHLASTKASDR